MYPFQKAPFHSPGLFSFLRNYSATEFKGVVRRRSTQAVSDLPSCPNGGMPLSVLLGAGQARQYRAQLRHADDRGAFWHSCHHWSQIPQVGSAKDVTGWISALIPSRTAAVHDADINFMDPS